MHGGLHALKTTAMKPHTLILATALLAAAIEAEEGIGLWRSWTLATGEWLKLHSEKGGRLIQHSSEGDGAAWGWEFDGRGRLRQLALCSVGKWT